MESLENQTMVNFDLQGLLNQYSLKLQSLVDVYYFTNSGVARTNEENYKNFHDFLSFYPAGENRLSYESAKDKTEKWLVRSVLSDVIDFTNSFLEECLLLLSLTSLIEGKKIKKEDFYQSYKKNRQKYNSLSFPEKIAQLNTKFSIVSAFENHVISINKARNCIVHRLGVVSEKDFNESDHLKISFRIIKLVAISPDDSTSVEIDKENFFVEGGWKICYVIEDLQRIFKLSDELEITQTELRNMIFTFDCFSKSVVKAIEVYAVNKGIPTKVGT